MNRQICRFSGLILAGTVLAAIGCGSGPSASSPDQRPEIELRVVKYPQFLEAIRASKGRIVVVDAWATWCLPCKQEFPHLVELHKKYAQDGVVCMSVSLDEPQNQKAALAFLESCQATFPNFLLEEGQGGFDLLDLKGIPAVFVYDRAGQLARKFTMDDPDNQFTYADVGKLVHELLDRDRDRKEK